MSISALFFFTVWDIEDQTEKKTSRNLGLNSKSINCLFNSIIAANKIWAYRKLKFQSIP